jgi:hypothetical protein
MPRFDTTDTAALESQVASYLNELPGETASLYQIWYEQLGGYGVPTPEDLVRIEAAVDKLGNWTSIGKTPDEKYGPVPKWRRDTGIGSTYDADGHIRVQHKFKVGGIYKTPDGTQYKISLAEVYNLRGFEIRDGQLVGPMIKIGPESELADSLVEV